METDVDLGRRVKLSNTIRSVFLNLLLSKRSRRMQRSCFELRRRLGRKGHVVSAFLQLDDPYSYLLSRYLPELASGYNIELRVYLSQARGDAYQPAPDMAPE